MQRNIKTLITLCAAIGVASCNLSTATSPTVTHLGSGPRKLLFIGNSLTAANDMPAMVIALAESAAVSPLPSADVDWAPDFALIDHLNTHQPQGIIASGHYDIVILQQGPSSVEINRDSLRLWTKMFDPLIRAAGGVPALFSVWPTVDRQVDFDRATESYRLAAQDVHGYMFPGGEVWRAAWRRDPSLQLYSQDGLHPSALGSYAVALSIVGKLYERSVVGLPAKFRMPTGETLAFDPATARLIQQAADEANATFGLTGVR